MENNIIVAQATDRERSQFYRKTYVNLALGVLAFVGIEAVLLRIPPLVEFLLGMLSGYTWLLLLGSFMAVTWLAQSITYKSASKSKQYLGFLLYIVAEAVIFVPILYIAIAVSGGVGLINQAAILTGALFLGLTGVVFGSSINFSFLRSILTIGFFLALGLIVAGMLFGFDLGLWFSVGVVALASGSILYSTYQLKNEYATHQYIPAALSLFASLMLLFWYILRILMSRN